MGSPMCLKIQTSPANNVCISMVRTTAASPTTAGANSWCGHKNAKGEPLDSAGLADVLFAPDVTLVTDSTGKKTYYLYPNDQHGGRNGLIAKSDRPDGPFEVCNWSEKDPNATDGVLAFDPAVFVDDDGRVYGYWGFGHSMGAELDPATRRRLMA